MPMNCRACGVDVPDGFYMKCSKQQCEKVYDLKCLGLTQEEFNTFSEKHIHDWVCPECVCSKPKPKRNDPDTPVRSTLEMKTYATSANVNTQRGSRSKTADESIVECDHDSILLSEFRQFRSEVLERLDMQTKVIKHLQEVCYSTKTELEELKTSMKVFQEKGVQKELLLTRNQACECVDSVSESLKSDVEVTNQVVIQTSFADVARSDYNVNKTNTTTRVSQTREATKTAPSVSQPDTASQLISQPHIVPVVELDSKEEENNEKNEWITVRKKKGSFPSKSVKKGKNADLVEIQATEKKKHLHVWRLCTETTVEKLTSHVKGVCGSEIYVKIEKIKHKTERDYASFIISVSESVYEKLCQPDMWPVNAEFCEWIWFRKPIKEKY